jgi:hypothetical protein
MPPGNASSALLATLNLETLSIDRSTAAEQKEVHVRHESTGHCLTTRGNLTLNGYQ